MTDFLMPSLGADMESGTLLEWRVAPGDRVERGDIVAVVDTDKAAIEIEIFGSGTVDELLVAPGEKVPVGTPLARLVPAAADTAPAHPGDAPAPPERTAPPARPAVATLAPAPRATPAARRHARELDLDLADLPGTGRHGVVTRADVARAEAAAADAGGAEAGPRSPPEAAPPLPARLRASPLARRLAAEAGLDLAAVAGTGPDGAIVVRDVERAAGGVTAPPAPSPAAAVRPGSDEQRSAAMRRAIAAAMGRSKREIPHYYLATRVDMSPALGWLERVNLQRPVTERLIPAALLLRATALAARDVPEMNGFWLDDEFRPSDEVHLGVGISLRQGGLIAPAIRHADAKDLATLMTELRDLTRRARLLQLRSSEMTDATLTTTNLGDRGVESVYGVIYPPQVAIVGFGTITPRPWADGAMLGVRPVLDLTLAADHRASDGHRGGLFLATIARYLHSPEEL